MAFSAPMTWEVMTTGAADNGGGFDPVTGTPGTDYSQQTAAQVTYTDLVIDATTNTDCTSAANAFTSVHVGNVINITSGTGFTVQRVQIMSVAAGVATCDKALGTTSSTGGNGKLGGALNTIQAALTLMTVAGMTCWIKATATYSISSGLLPVAGATSGTIATRVMGYTTTRGDMGRVTVLATAAIDMLTHLNGLRSWKFANFVLDGNDTASQGIQAALSTVNECQWTNIKIQDCTGMGVNAEGTSRQVFTDVEVSGCGGANASFKLSNTTSSQSICLRCWSHDNSVRGFNCAGTKMINCMATNNAGNGFECNLYAPSLINCISYGNGGQGVYAGNYTAGFGQIDGCIFAENAGYGINFASTGEVTDVYPQINNNAFFSNGLGDRLNLAVSAGDIPLTADPFVDPASDDFNINNDAGGGALLRAATVTI